MADDTDVQVDDSVDTEDQLAKARQAMALNAAAQQVEAAAVAPPRNRTYMGPNIGGPTNPQEFFGSLPGGRIVMPPSWRNPAPLPPEAQAALQSRIATATQPESDQALLARVQAQDQPGSATIGVSRPPMPSWQDRYTQGGVTDVAGLAKEAELRDKANRAMLMNDWYEKVRRVGVVAAGPPPDIRSSAPWRVPTSQTTSRNVGGVLYELNPSTGQWEPKTTRNVAPSKLPEGLVNMHKALIAQWVAETDPDKKKAARAELDDFIKQHPEVIGGTATKTATTAAPAAPVPAPSAAPGKAPPKVTSQKQFDALPSGAVYIGTDGKRKRKP